MSNHVIMRALKGIPMINESDTISDVILTGLKKEGIELQCDDILVVCQKIVSKAEGQKVDLRTVIPSEKALDLAKKCNKDPRLVELVLNESEEVLRCLPAKIKGHLIVRHRLGIVMANAGIDQSNIQHDNDNDNDNDNTHALLLPKDPVKSCQEIHNAIFQVCGKKVGIIINDSIGRPWRIGTTGMAIGLAGLPATLDLNGQSDIFGRLFSSTEIGFADEVSAAASLLMGQSTECCPIVHIRGITYNKQASLGTKLVRPKEMDLFV